MPGQVSIQEDDGVHTLIVMQVETFSACSPNSNINSCGGFSYKDFICQSLHVQVKDYPGLLRVSAWVLNGLELVVKKAK